MTLSSSQLALSILRCSAELLSLNLALDAIDLDGETFTFGHDRGAEIGGVSIDSVELQEVLVTLETELGIDLLGIDDLDRVSTMDGLVAFVEAEAPPDGIAAFLERWEPSR
jgi:acyl carrier protein